MTNRISLHPLFVCSVGFDQFESFFDSLGRSSDPDEAFPAYDVERIGDEGYRIVVAVPGFASTDLALSVVDQTLRLTGNMHEAANRSYLYKGIALRAFEGHFV